MKAILFALLLLCISQGRHQTRGIQMPNEYIVKDLIHESVGIETLETPHFNIYFNHNPTTRWDHPIMYFKSHILVVQKTILDNVPGILEKFFWGFSKFMEFRTQGMNGKLSLIDENFLEHK